MAFTGTLDKCKACDKTVYVVDMLSLEGLPYHKSCFKCSHCKGFLSVFIFLSSSFTFVFPFWHNVYVHCSFFLASNYAGVNDSQLLIDRVHSKTPINQWLTIIHAWIRLMGICTFTIWIIQKCKWLRNIFIFDRWAPIPPWMESSIANLILSSFSRNLGISARILVKLIFLVLHFFTFWIIAASFFFLVPSFN